MLYPKENTLEAVVLAKLLAAGNKGVTYLDFKDHIEITEHKLEEIIKNLEHGIFESNQDDMLKFDS